MRIKTFFFKMATKEMDVNTENEHEIRDTGAAEALSPEVTVTRKRKNKVEIMETDTTAKKPNFPSVSIEEGVKTFWFFGYLIKHTSLTSFMSFLLMYLILICYPVSNSNAS